MDRTTDGSRQRVIICGTCVRPICPENANIREYLMKSKPISIGCFSKVNRLCPEPAAFLIEYYCPSCCTLLSTDIVLEEEAQTSWPGFELSVKNR